MLNKKYLITNGCSFTEGHYMGSTASWATYFAKNNNLKLLNLGKGGIGNGYIISNTIQYSIINKEIAENAIFGIQLSEVLRTLMCLDFPDTIGYPKYWHITPVQFIHEHTFDNWDLNEHHNKFIYKNRYALSPFFINITHSVSITINALINFINFCEKNNYPYFIFDGINKNIPEKTNDGWGLVGEAEIDNHKVEVIEESQSIEEYLKNTYPVIQKSIIDYLNTIKNYIKDIDYKQYVLNMGQNEHGDSDFYFKGNQSHPNKEGAELWAKYLQKKVEEILI
jgi:hypothetical protein